MIDSKTGQCCSSLSKSGDCNSPRDGQVHNPPYGFPDHRPALIVEGNTAYPYGPPVWSPTNPSGSYGWTVTLPGTDVKSDQDCPAIPAEIKVDRSRVKAMSAVEHGNGNLPHMTSCFLGCNLTEVSDTGVDPCNSNSGSTPTAGPYNMSCFSGGENWLSPANTGMCGYNCTLRHANDPAKFSSNNSAGSDGVVYCNTLGFGWHTNSFLSATANKSSGSGQMHFLQIR